MREYFKKNKFVIGMVHFPPLPGTANFNDDSGLSKIIKSVEEDLEALQKGGIDAIMFGNEGDRPYSLRASNSSLATGNLKFLNSQLEAFDLLANLSNSRSISSS